MFVVSEIVYGEKQICNIFEEWDNAISVIFDSLNRKNMVISENSYQSQHIFRFNVDGLIIGVDHNCAEYTNCKYHNLDELNR